MIRVQHYSLERLEPLGKPTPAQTKYILPLHTSMKEEVWV